ncbi:Na+/H+ antiporter NhaA [Nocardioides aequoreus]|uniref:Na+/H+ antiporter NhaA n=1 Tax=Nocardioides aequoreus TaxID=397278 RepID=UPI00068D3907|nr:Na+/H+ antiporter NhaA [Nocardioides aequoreus]
MPAISRHRSALSFLSRETTGGVLLILAATLALTWANSPWREGYAALTDTVVGPSALRLDLSLGAWAADGALAIFFFVVGLELKHEIVAGSLRNWREAAVPVVAAVGGMIVPAVLFLTVLRIGGRPDLASGWAIPTATDIAFALAVLAIFGRGLPSAIRVFLLTLAVVDDLLAVSIIAVFYTSDLHLGWLTLGLLIVALFALLARRQRASTLLLVAVAVPAWVFVHESGVHATIVGVLLGMVVPATARHGEEHARVHTYEGIARPLSSALALPVFAFFAAGVTVVGEGGGLALLGEPLLLAVVAGLLGGKLLGILGGAALATRLPGLRLQGSTTLRDLVPVALLAAIGFTVSLLIGELSYADSATVDLAKVAVLLSSVVAAVLAAVTLRWDARRRRRATVEQDEHVQEVDAAPRAG